MFGTDWLKSLLDKKDLKACSLHYSFGSSATSQDIVLQKDRGLLSEISKIPPVYSPIASLPKVRETALTPPLKSIDWGTELKTEVVDVYFAPAGFAVDGVISNGWTDYATDQAILALSQISEVADIEFQRVYSPSVAEFRLITYDFDDPNILSLMWPPGTENAGFAAFNSEGLGWDDDLPGTGALERGGFGFVTLLHEFGHGVGGAHPHDKGGTSSIMEGVTSPFGSYGEGQLNQGVFTVMSYNSGWPAGPAGPLPVVGANYGHEGSMMALDIALLQRKYGANSNHSPTDDVYDLPDANALANFYQCIWDTGGVDEIRARPDLAATIDLRAASLLQETGGGGYVSYAVGIRGGFTIANSVVIENATGSELADTLIGNEHANFLQGNGGNDTLRGKAQADLLFGSEGDDLLFGGTGRDILHGGADDDMLKGGDKADQLTGGAGNDSLDGGAGFDYVRYETDDHWGGFQGIAANLAAGIVTDPFDCTDTIFEIEGVVGSNFADSIVGNDKTNDFVGLVGDDTILGKAGDDELRGGEGNDVLKGGKGNDRAWGDEGSDRLVGGSGKDKLNAGEDDDTLIGGKGQDRLVGGAGADVFIFNDNSGNDKIVDFDALDDFEIIDLSAVTAIKNFTDLLRNHLEEAGTDLIIDDAHGNSIKLVDVDLFDIDASDFLF